MKKSYFSEFGMDQKYFPRVCRYNVPYDYDTECSERLRETIGATVATVATVLQSEVDPQHQCHLVSDVTPSILCDASKLKNVPTEGCIALTDSIVLYDIPNQNSLGKKSHLCGYITPEGTYHKCKSCEHEKIVRKLVLENDLARRWYLDTPKEFFETLPRGMYQEEYFAMKKMGWAKISSFKDTPTDMVVFWYDKLTPRQSEIIYPV